MNDPSPAGTVKVALVQEDNFRHDALFYSDEDEFLRGTLPFIADGLAADEPLMIAVSDAKLALLKEALGGEADGVLFMDAHAHARNPARLIPAWREFLLDHAPDGRARGIEESVWPGRSAAELSECERHEALLDTAFADQPGFRMLCPYDVGALGAPAIDAARLTHPLSERGADRAQNGHSRAASRPPRPFDGTLPEPGGEVERLAFTAGGLGEVRNLVSRRAAHAQLSDEAREGLVLAINELVTNSVQYGGGGGTIAIWMEGDSLLCEVRDHGRIEDPLIGRLAPPLDLHGGRGIWLVNQLCDLVQIRWTSAGNVVRVHMHGGAVSSAQPVTRRRAEEPR
jgi:anti-sigma regulatory factor (Ser/Thr protein kinase)